ncbi:MAG: thioredoxin domain-containing protein [Bacteroidetes bacterium]|nr:thioredoxin domain-containing protein [Bacteroidota bacterium]
MIKKISSPIFLSFVFILLFVNAKSINSPKWSHFDPEIFAKAKKENKLVLLHLRANWCHWCHVMEEKTYTDQKVIDYLAKNYIACMEDHDERQDLTSLYSDYGWPATIIFDGDGNELLKEPGYINAEEFLATLAKLKKDPKPLAGTAVNADPKLTTETSKQKSLNDLKRSFNRSLDIASGGFVFGQKYIEFDTFEYAFTHQKSDSLLKMWLTHSVVNSTGIYDKVWGGVFQYSTDNDWDHVHYEKLLFIQARYIKMYCWYYKIFNDAEALKKAEGIVDYVNRFLTAPGGGYYNAQDADLIKGEKAKEYFELGDKERMKKGIPAIDSNVYTSDNAAYAEALTILWATSGKQNYLDKALNCIQFLNTKRKAGNIFMHGEKYAATTSLKDNLAMLKTLMLAHRATQRQVYRADAEQLIKEIAANFNSGRGYFYTYIGKSAIKSTYNVSENIEACRLLNYCSYFFHEPDYKKTANEILNFLTNDKLVSTLSTEPGILSAAEELTNEPIIAALMLKKNDDLTPGYLKETIAFPRFYFNSVIYDKGNVIEDKKDLFDSFDDNFMILCTSSYCSSPLFNPKEFSEFMYKRVLEK